MGYQYASKKLEVYKQELEKAVIAHAGQHYQRQSREWMDQDSAPVYMEKVEKILQAERNRVEAYLNRCTLEPLHKEVSRAAEHRPPAPATSVSAQTHSPPLSLSHSATCRC